VKHYVAGFMKDRLDRVALVRKNKPAWQAGRLNGIGGGIEAGETPQAAMKREWLEETGTRFEGWIRFAEIRFPETIVHFFKAEVCELPAFPSHNDIGERLEVWDLSIVVRAANDNMLPNLKWLLPMAFEDPDAKMALLTPIDTTVSGYYYTANEIRREHGLPPIPANDNLSISDNELKECFLLQDGTSAVAA
jgi:8-oxo-dGTP diphosphatase